MAVKEYFTIFTKSIHSNENGGRDVPTAMYIVYSVYNFSTCARNLFMESSISKYSRSYI